MRNSNIFFLKKIKKVFVNNELTASNMIQREKEIGTIKRKKRVVKKNIFIEKKKPQIIHERLVTSNTQTKIMKNKK